MDAGVKMANDHLVANLKLHWVIDLTSVGYGVAIGLGCVIAVYGIWRLCVRVKK